MTTAEIERHAEEMAQRGLRIAHAMLHVYGDKCDCGQSVREILDDEGTGGFFAYPADLDEKRRSERRSDATSRADEYPGTPENPLIKRSAGLV